MNKEPITCSCCGKRIRKGQKIYKMRGYYWDCCSKSCLLDVYTGATYSIISKGYRDEDEEEQ